MIMVIFFLRESFPRTFALYNIKIVLCSVSCHISLQNRSKSQICTTDEALIQAPHNSRDQNAKEPDLDIYVCQQIWWRMNLTWLDLLNQHGLYSALNVELEHYVGRLKFRQENVFISTEGSKLTFSGCCDRRLPYDSHDSHPNYFIYIREALQKIVF